MRVPLVWAGRFGTNVWLLMANTFFIFVGLGVFALIFNLYLASLGLQEDYIGLCAFANTVAIGGFAIPAGVLSNRFGPRACLMVASVLMGLAATVVSVVPDPRLIVAVSALMGAATALIFVPSGPFLMENSGEDERLQVFSANAAFISLASVLGSLASGYLPALLAATLGFGAAQSTPAYRWTLLFGALCCALGAVPMLFVRPDRRPPPVAKSALPTVTPLSEGAARRLLLAIAAAVSMMAAATGLILPFFNVYLSRQLGASVELIGVIYAAASLLMVPSSLIGPSLARRLGTVGAVAAPRVLTVPFLLSLALTPSLSLGAIVYVARAALVSATFPPDNAFSMELMPPRLRAMQAGVRSASWNIGWSLASLIAGQAIVTLGYPVVFAASALLTLLGTIYYFVVFRRHEPRPVRATQPA